MDLSLGFLVFLVTTWLSSTVAATHAPVGVLIETQTTKNYILDLVVQTKSDQNDESIDGIIPGLVGADGQSNWTEAANTTIDLDVNPTSTVPSGTSAIADTGVTPTASQDNVTTTVSQDDATTTVSQDDVTTTVSQDDVTTIASQDDVIEVNCLNMQTISVKSESEIRNKTWLMSCPNQYYHMLIDVETAENLTQCGRALLLGAGHHILESPPALVVGERDVTPSVYIPTNQAYAYWLKETDQSAAFQLKCECQRVITESLSRIPMTTPVTAPAHESLPICVVNVDLNTTLQFLKLGPLARGFLYALQNATAYICPEAPRTSAHIVWPVYIHEDCQYSDSSYSSSNRYCACFNISIVLEGESKCSGVKAGGSLPQETLKRILNMLYWEVAVVYENDKHLFKIQLVETPFPLSLVLGPIVLCGLFVLILFWCWWKRDYWDQAPTKKPPAEEKDPFEVQMYPPKMQNPLFGARDSTYFGDDVTYNPDFEDAAALSSVDEEDEDEGKDNPAFILDEDNPRPTAPPLSPSNSDRFFASFPPTSESRTTASNIYPEVEMDVLQAEINNLPTTRSGAQIVNDFSRAKRYTNENMFKKTSISSSGDGSPKTTPNTKKRVGFLTPSPTLSRSSKHKDEDDIEAHFYEVTFKEEEEEEETDL